MNSSIKAMKLIAYCDHCVDSPAFALLLPPSRFPALFWLFFAVFSFLLVDFGTRPAPLGHSIQFLLPVLLWLSGKVLGTARRMLWTDVAGPKWEWFAVALDLSDHPGADSHPVCHRLCIDKKRSWSYFRAWNLKISNFINSIAESTK